MAEAMMSRTGILSPSTSIHRQYPCPPHGLSVFPTKSAMFSSGTGIGIGFSSLKLTRPIFLRSSSFSSFNSDQVFEGIPKIWNTRSSSSFVSAQMRGGIIGKTQKWWEKGLQPNMMEVKDAQDLVESLLNAWDKLVIVDFFSPGCGGCKSLHPKICQLAEINPDVQFLQVNYEEHKSMCYTLNVHVLPFFRFYRGSHGRLCSFSCTNATIKKFKDALAKHSPEQCSLGPPKGLEEKELLALAANKDLSFNYDVAPTLKPETAPAPQEILIEASPLRTSLSSVKSTGFFSRH